MKNDERKDKGITLIALVITIIILVILAGISIMMISSNNGILRNAGIAKEVSEEAQKDEKNKVDELEKIVTGKTDKIDDKKYVEQGYKARIDAIYYKTVQSAIEDIKKNNTKTTVVMIDDSIECITVYENQNIVLKLNGKILDSDDINYQTILNKGTLSIEGGVLKCKDSNVICNYGVCEVKENTKVTSQNENKGTSIMNYDGGNLTINGTNIYGKTGGGINNKSGGIVNINDAVIKSDSSTTAAVVNSGTCHIDGNTNIDSSGSNSLYNSGICEVKGTTQINSTVEQNYPTVINKAEAELNILGGEIHSTKYNAIWNQKNGILKISGGHISVESGQTLRNEGICEITKTPEIDSVDNCTVYNTAESTLKIQGGTFTSENSNTIQNYGGIELRYDPVISSKNEKNCPTVVNFSGGNIDYWGGNIFSEKSYGVWNKSGSTLSVLGGTIESSESIAVKNESEATLNITGGLITSKSKNGLCNYGICNIEKNANISLSSNTNYPAVVNYSGGNIIMNLGKIYCKNSYGVWNKEGGKFTFNGGKITSINSYAIYNSGEYIGGDAANISGKTYGID